MCLETLTGQAPANEAATRYLRNMIWRARITLIASLLWRWLYARRSYLS